MMQRFAPFAFLAIAACSSGFPNPKGNRRLTVEIIQGDTGTAVKPLALPIDKTLPFTIRVKAFNPDGSIDTGFSSYVRISAKPGAIAPIATDGADGRNVLLQGGVSQDVEVQLSNAFGTTYILADDLGYIPADPLRNPPPQCADGVDNDGDGAIDSPADPGCAFANDDSELSGTFEQGASGPITFALPRIADARGLKCDNQNICSSSGISPYQKEAIQLDAGLRLLEDGTQKYAFDLVVTRIASNGFYVQDTKDGRGGFNSVFAFNFSAPPLMRVCDYLRAVSGTAGEFFGFTQLSFPTWTIEDWDPAKRPCNVPEPTSLRPDGIDTPTLLRLSGGLVRAETIKGGIRDAHVSGKLGAGDVPNEIIQGVKVFTPGVDATNCDYNKDGKIDFTLGADEGACSNACTADLECIEYSNFISRSTFRIVISDPSSRGAVQADASAATGFDVRAMKGQPIRSFTGTMTYFSGGAQFTIEARCTDDIVVDLAAAPIPSDKACVLPRTFLELNPQ